ncbi:MAG: hypothetical protein JRJ41_04220 [Deltaproteobacteria bacterium]|jgi:hypothetical protein|nr:hypothetical protein [Deltaproteobacteria bacterium]
MGKKLDQDQIAAFEELLISNTIQLDVVTQLLIEKGIIAENEFSDMLKRVQMEYQKSKD